LRRLFCLSPFARHSGFPVIFMGVGNNVRYSYAEPVVACGFAIACGLVF
jgi:hypothetical protein